MLLFSISQNLSLRGAGLGNELIPAAKSYLVSRATGARLIGHSWGLNPRGYGKRFGTSLFDRVPVAAAETVCETRRITVDDWRRHRIEGYGQLAAAVFNSQDWISPLRCLVSSGMWGGYAVIDDARDWVRSQLSAAEGVALRMLEFEKATSGNSLRVGVHVRRGDFLQTPDDLRGKFNVQLPATWYQQVISGLRDHCGEHAIFCLFGDGNQEEKAAMLEFAGRSWMPEAGGHDMADLLALSSCDVIVCSASSYSLMAAWLGRMPYLWMKEQMVQIGSRLTFWGHEADSGNWLMADSLAYQPAPATSPCVPIGLDEVWPSKHLDNVLAGRWERDRRCDPIRYGAV